MKFLRLFNRERVLALAPTTRGIGFIVFEGPQLPLDWGMRFAKGDKNTQCVQRAAELFDRYKPDVIVLENYSGPGSRRSKRVQTLIEDIAARAKERGVSSRRYARSEIRQCFATSGASNKQQIAEAVGTEYRQLRRFVPPRRKIWLPEHYRMAIFDAASLALTHYDCGAKEKRAA